MCLLMLTGCKLHHRGLRNKDVSGWIKDVSVYWALCICAFNLHLNLYTAAFLCTARGPVLETAGSQGRDTGSVSVSETRD